MSTSHQQAPPRSNGPKFTTGQLARRTLPGIFDDISPGTTRWPRVNGASLERTASSDSDTERDFRSTSRSDPSSRSQAHRSRGPNGRRSPEGRVTASIETTPEAPAVPYWSGKRHLTCGNPTPGPPWSSKNTPWRGSAPGKLKTSNAALILCLNIDVDPPDIVKTNPCAVLECWVDPHSMPSKKALEAIGTNLQHQFEGLSTKISYKPILDPEIDDLRRFCMALRKQSKDDAVVFYYNGHGVPKPTASGELWCFNKDYTQYIPISIQEVQGWIGSPGVYIWDCSAAGNLLHNFNIFAERRDHEVITAHGGFPEGAQPMMNSLQLAACGANETLPTCPELPADVFTACLTSPIDIALRFFIMNHQLPNNITQDMVTQLPGDLKDRRTPLGELNWIFTAITDTIAWTTFSRETFTRLYRCDLLIASLFRNFLLAERIMKDYHCTPHTYPPLPATNTHPLWATWDLAVDACLRQLPDLLTKPGTSVLPSTGTVPGRIGQTTRDDPSGTVKPPEKPYVYVPSRFFADQLTAFEVWISRGGSALTRRGPLSLPQLPGDTSNTQSQPSDQDHASDRHLVPRKPPDQLPIVLQVLLSQPHRLRALILLSQFVDLGPWAVHLVLTIGIFPYISKLLQAAGQDLRPVLIFIWARIIAVDSSVQTDLYNTQGFKYFSNILSIRNEDNLPNSSEHKAMCSFILASIARDFPHGQMACLHERVFDNCYELLEESDFLLRQWTTLCIAQLWDGNDEIKVWGVDRGTQDKLVTTLSDVSAEVRAAALYALGTFLGASGSADPNKQGGGGSGKMQHLDEFTHFKMEVAVVTGATLAIKDDASPMCRKELLVLISCLVKEWRGYFVVCAWLYWEEDRRWRSQTAGHTSYFYDEDVTNQAVADWLEAFGDEDEKREEYRVVLSSFFTIFVLLLDLSVDPYEEVATNAQTIVDYIMALLLESPFTRMDSSSLNSAPISPYDKRGPPKPNNPRTRVSSLQSSPNLSHQVPPSPGSERPGLSRNDSVATTLVGGMASTIKRTSSFANALKVLAGGIAFPHSEDGRSSPSLASTLLPSQLRSDHQHHESVDVSRPPSPNMNLAKYTSPYSRPPSVRQVNSEYDGSPPRHNELESQPPMDFLACDVMEALMEEDMERLRARRRMGYNHRNHGGRGSLPSPSNSTFSMDSTNSSVILGIGTGAGIRDCLPLKSTFYDWCAEYFKEPQMRQTEADEPGSIQYNYQVWRQLRNDQVTKETDAQAPLAENHRWDRPVATLTVSGHPMTMAFHSYDKHLVIANEHDMISVWDWNTRKRLNYFCNGNPRGTSITGLHIINQEIGGIIVTGSADGIVRLYRNYDPTLEQGPLQMVSAFRGLNEIVQSRQGSGLVMDWKQSGGSLLVGGDSRVIKVWDASTEQQGLDLDTNSDSPVTSIAHDVGSSKTFVAGFADGVVKVFDGRLEDDDAIVRTYSDHTSWVQNVRWHPTLSGQLLSAGIDGEVKLFDLRSSDYATRTWNIHPDGLSAFDVHPISNVFAANSSISPLHWKTQRIVVHSLNKPSPLSAFSVTTGLISPPVRGLPSPFFPRSSSLVFHPTQMLYASGGPDGCVRIIGCGLA
ncbi:hypothetical protein CVT25_002630 [Psilocybe cyanescens]|uniref:Raptor N-terminal CASPase-like domain-containing protein n=1 Tax=Psilocybe cyanescens TaxID=93625 RepID=A0A409WLR2_PSICY|nr:hypothetical protein CVT25_002630 [Psilocybe cyanescens]